MVAHARMDGSEGRKEGREEGENRDGGHRDCEDVNARIIVSLEVPLVHCSSRHKCAAPSSTILFCSPHVCSVPVPQAQRRARESSKSKFAIVKSAQGRREREIGNGRVTLTMSDGENTSGR